MKQTPLKPTARWTLSSACVLLCCLTLVTQVARAQENVPPPKGSYLYGGQPAIEDNSMLIEEAFNQETGVIQHISNFVFDHGDFVYTYTQEIPLDDYRHQLSFSVPFARIKTAGELPVRGNDQFFQSGLGDVYINYRPLLWGKNDWALVIPRFTLILPTGNSQYGLGTGGMGAQFNLAVTKRIAPKLVGHYNAGFTKFYHADYYQTTETGASQLQFEKDLVMKNVGTSLIWFARPRFNLMLEYLTNFENEILADGTTAKNRTTVVNPGLRFAFDIGKVQIVPGVGVPFNFNQGSFSNTSAFFYLSIEPAY